MPHSSNHMTPAEMPLHHLLKHDESGHVLESCREKWHELNNYVDELSAQLQADDRTGKHRASRFHEALRCAERILDASADDRR